MTSVFEMIGPILAGLSVAVALFAGFVKGAVVFGMPMIMISAIGSFLSPELALAALILPTVVSNLWQAFRGGWLAAWRSVKEFRLMIVTLLVVIAASAQLVGRIPSGWFFLVLGGPIVLFALLQLTGLRIRVRPEHRRRAEVIVGLIGGTTGGISGVWGPPVVAFLSATDTAKAEQVRVQGVIYGAGSIVLLLSHVKSGVLNAQTVWFSLALVLPAALGMGLGFALHDRLDQEKFRRATLVVLVLAGLNLIRRGLLLG